jgi:hypothetical protein
MQITNNHSSALGLPDGQLLPARQTTAVRDWDRIRKNAVVQAWLRAKVLTEGEAMRSQFVLADKEELIAKLTALGVKADKRYHITKLQGLLAKAEAKAANNPAVTNVSEDVPPGTGPFISQD